MIIKDRFAYPSDNIVDFEYYSIMNIRNEERKPLPVTWTAYYKLAKYGKDERKIKELQNYLNGLTGKYFTVVQWDDGLLNDISHLDCIVFGMGKNIGYPLPLICTPHKFRFSGSRNIKYSFVGKNTHPIRSELLKLGGGYITENKHKMHDYCRVLASSVFGLCPRGYGITSFRIMECMQYGAIPVYISDVFQFPHNVDFNDYGVVIKENEIQHIPDILNSMSRDEIQHKQNKVREYYRGYYTYEANKRIIVDYIRKNA